MVDVVVLPFTEFKKIHWSLIWSQRSNKYHSHFEQSFLFPVRTDIETQMSPIRKPSKLKPLKRPYSKMLARGLLP